MTWHNKYGGTDFEELAFDIGFDPMDQTDAGKLAREVDLSATRDNGLVRNQKKRRGDTPRVWEPFSNARYGTALRAREGEWQIDKRPPAVVLPVTYSFYGIFWARFLPQNCG